MPTTAEEKQAVVEAIQRTAGHVLVRSMLTDLIGKVATRSPSEAVLAQLPNDAARDSFRRARAFDIKQVGFSDCFVTSVFLHDKGEVEGVARVAATLYSALQGHCGHMLASVGTQDSHARRRRHWNRN
jgi:hypothetical protein